MAMRVHMRTSRHMAMLAILYTGYTVSTVRTVKYNTYRYFPNLTSSSK